MKTQRERVLAYLRACGERGGDPTAFLLPNVVDGGKPILNWGARILELRQAGHQIEAAGRRNGCVVMVLTRDADQARDPLAGRSGSGPSVDVLLEVPATPVNALLGWDT